MTRQLGQRLLSSQGWAVLGSAPRRRTPPPLLADASCAGNNFISGSSNTRAGVVHLAPELRRVEASSANQSQGTARMYITMSTTTASSSKRNGMDTSLVELSTEPSLSSTVCAVERTQCGACAVWLSSAKADLRATAARVSQPPSKRTPSQNKGSLG